MNSRWANSKTFLPGLLVTTVAIIGVLTILVMHQRHDLSTVDERIHSRTDLTVPTSPAPQVFPVPQVAPTTPAPVTPASRIMPPQVVRSPWAPLKPKKSSYRRTNPAPTRPPVAAHPAIPVPQTNPNAKPGGPDGW